jgi:hypothetical protein
MLFRLCRVKRYLSRLAVPIPSGWSATRTVLASKRRWIEFCRHINAHLVEVELTENAKFHYGKPRQVMSTVA